MERSNSIHDEDNKEAYEIRMLIDENLHQIRHLERSQNELREALKETPDDADFIIAVAENDKIIAAKKHKVVELREILRHMDPAYNEEKHAEQAMRRRDPTGRQTWDETQAYCTTLANSADENEELGRLDLNRDSGIYL
jgi:hypothetical protein